LLGSSDGNFQTAVVAQPVSPAFSIRPAQPGAAIARLDPGTNVISGQRLRVSTLNISGVCTITIVVSDGMDTATNAFLFTVTPVNDPPVLAAIANRRVHVGSTVIVSNSATDLDLPPDELIFSLGVIHPPGSAIDPGTGVFTWTPDASFTDTTNTVEIKVTDNGVPPPLSDTKSFLIAVEPPPLIQSVVVSNEIVTITWSAICGQVYRVQYNGNLNEPIWTNLSPDVTAEGSSAEKEDILTPFERFYRVNVVP
jgi:hypothetical protein